MAFLDFFNNRTKAHEIAEGSDGRVNVSARADSRAYYNSRDKNKTFSLPFKDAACSAGDFNVVMFNDDTVDDLVIKTVNCSSSTLSVFAFHRVTVAAGGGAVSATPVNLHLGESDAVVTASTVVNSDSTPISGTVTAGILGYRGVGAGGNAQFDFGDTVRLKKGQGVALELDKGTSASVVSGEIIFYFEQD